MNYKQLIFIVSFGSILAGCGGGDDNNTAYSFVIPAVGSQRVYAETLVDDQSNTINQSYTATVTATTTTGFTQSEIYSSPSSFVGGALFPTLSHTDTLNNSGLTLSSSYNYGYSPPCARGASCVTLVASVSYTLIDSPYAGGAIFPLSVGQTWNTSYTQTCADNGFNGSCSIVGQNTAVTYTDKGSVVDVESVTVPAGTFNALKLQSTINFTNAAGTNITRNVTEWRDTNTGHVVKAISANTYSGTMPTTGYVVQRTVSLQSLS